LNRFIRPTNPVRALRAARGWDLRCAEGLLRCTAAGSRLILSLAVERRFVTGLIQLREDIETRFGLQYPQKGDEST